MLVTLGDRHHLDGLVVIGDNGNGDPDLPSGGGNYRCGGE